MYFSNLLSLSIIFIYIIPLILYIISGNYIHFKALFYLSGTTIISESIKYFLIGNSNPRPNSAKDCNLLCNDGNQSGKPGMPSSHSASVAFFSGFYYQQTNNTIIRISLIVYSGFVMLSRYWKKCHTISQIVVGALIGLTLSWLVVRHL
jgi:membrane-associated phospholipid phosphatase